MDLQTMFTAFAPAPTIVTERPSRHDAHDITKSVAKHCHLVGCDESNTIAAVAWALKEPGDTLKAIRAGKKRADCLRLRQHATPRLA